MYRLIILLAYLTRNEAFRFYGAEDLKPCPKVHPTGSFVLDELKGRWHLSLLVLDAENEELEETNACVTGEVALINATQMKQVWDIYTPNEPNEPVGTMELIISVVDQGVWSVQTPLGELEAIVFGYEMGCLMIAHCGWHRGKLVHLWTAGISKENILTPSLRIKLSFLLLDNGYEPSTTKIITWNKC